MITNVKTDEYYVEKINDYYKKNGVNPPYGYVNEDGIDLWQWINVKLYRIKIGSLSDEEVVFIKDNMINIDIKPLLWAEWYQMLKGYFTTTGNDYIVEPYVVNRTYKLGKWAYRQYRNFWNLTTEQKLLLKELPWDKIASITMTKEEMIEQKKEEKEKAREIEKQRKEEKRRKRESDRLNKQLLADKKLIQLKEQVKADIEKNYINDMNGYNCLEVQLYKVGHETTSILSDNIVIAFEINNTTNQCIDFEIKEFTLFHNKRKKTSDYIKGYIKDKATILPNSRRTIIREYSDYNLKETGFSCGDKLEIAIHDITNDITFSKQYIYDGDTQWLTMYEGIEHHSDGRKKLKEVISFSDIKVNKSSFRTFFGLCDGYTIHMTIENTSNKYIQYEVMDFYLVQETEIRYDVVKNKIFEKENEIQPHSKTDVSRSWLEYSLQKEISNGDYLCCVINDLTNRKQYLARFDFDGITWNNTYFTIRKQ